MSALVPAPKRLYSRSAIVVASALLCSCSLFQPEGPESAKALIGDAPEAWKAADAGTVTAQPLGEGWLDDFQMPQLYALTEEVWRNNWSLLTAIARRDQAAARAQIDKAALYPRLDAQGQVGRQRQINDFLGGNPLIPEEAYISRIRVGVGVNWELDLWGRAFNMKEASVGEVWAADLDVEAAKFSLAGQAAVLWFDLIAAQRQLDLTNELVSNYERAVLISEDRRAAGLSTNADLRQIKSEAAAARADAVARRLDRGQAARALEVLLGRYPANELQPDTELPPLPPTLSAGVPSELLERRPDVQAAALRVLSSDQRLLAAKKNLLPHFTISAQAAFQSAYRDTLIDDDAFVWSIGGGILQPLFDGGQIRAGIKAQRAAMFESIYRYRDKVYSAFLEVENGLAADAELREQRRFVVESEALARDNEEQARESFEQGSLDARIWLATVRAGLQAQARLVDVDTRLLKNRVSLSLALGGSPILEPRDAEQTTDAPAEPVIEPVDGAETMAEPGNTVSPLIP